MKPLSRQLAIGVCALQVFTGTLFADVSTKVKIAHWGHEKILIYAPLYIAMDGGFFAKEGLDIELVYSGNDDQVFATVISGAAQFGVGDPAFTAISREKGGEGKVIAALVGRVANWAVTKNPAIQPFTDPKELDGKRVTSFPSPSTTFTILSGLKKDLNLSKMEIKQLAFGTEQAAVERGEADLAIMLEPQTSVAESQGFRVVWSVAKYYGDFALTGVTTTDSFIKKDPETVQRFVNALQAALNFSAKDPEAAATILEKSFATLQAPIVRSAMKRMVEDQTIPRNAAIDKEAWLKTLKLRQIVGDLKSLDVADACLDSTFAEIAMQGISVQKSQKNVGPSSGHESNFWKWFGRIADVTAVFAFATIFLIFWEHRKINVAWNSLSKFEQDCGRHVASCFANPEDSCEWQHMYRVLTENHLIEKESAENVIRRFAEVALIKKIKGTDRYVPVVTTFAKLVPLFQLCR
jgi:NitT/TauT family transport system substrate-binding protein